jgi:hypothetical protein
MGLHRIALALAFAACTAAPAALADRGRHNGGDGHHDGGHGSVYWGIGIPFGYGYGYGPGYYGGPWGGPWMEPWPYERRIYIERERRAEPELPSGPPPAAMWYYCDSAGAYYPYVGTCPEPWRQVPAEPPTPTGSERR